MPVDPTDPQFPSDKRSNRDLFASGSRGGGPPDLSGNEGQSAKSKASEKAGSAAGKAIGAGLGGTAGAKIGGQIGKFAMGGGDDPNDPRRKIRKWLLRFAVASWLVQLLMVVVIFAPIGIVASVVLGNKGGKMITGLACSADGVASSVGLKHKSEACKARDEIVAALSDKDKEAIDKYAKEDFETALDCSNVTPLQRAAGECVEGLLDYGEDNASVIPQRALWLMPIWQQAAEKYNVPWQLIAAVNGGRTNFGYLDCPAGHRGDPGEGFYRQNPDEWNRYAVDAGKSTVKKSGICRTSTSPAKVRTNKQIQKDADQRDNEAGPFFGADYFDAVDSTFAIARQLSAQGATANTWKYNGSSASSCTTSTSDGRFFYVPDNSTYAADAKLGYNAKLEIPQDISVLAAKWRGKREAMPKADIMKILVAAWEAFGQDPQTAQRNATLNYLRVIQESGGKNNNPNNWDSNAAAGTPSTGLFHFIQPTFDSYKVSGFDDLLNPLDSTLAAVNAQANATISFGNTVNGILTSGGAWAPGAWKHGSNPYATGGHATVVDETDPYQADKKATGKKSATPTTTVKYKGDKPTDATSQAVRFYGEKMQMSSCYVAQVHEWYQSIVDNPPTDGAFTADANSIRGRMVQIAKQELKLHLHETTENCGPPLDKYWGKGVCGGGSTPWCAMFATWVGKKAGLKNDYPTQAAPLQDSYAPDIKNWAAARGLWHPADDGYKPKPGDFALWNEGSHINIVVKSTSDGYSTIGGNQSDTVTYQPDGSVMGTLWGFVEPVKGNPAATPADGLKKSGNIPSSKPPEIRSKYIDFGPERKAEMAQYSKVHYGSASWKLNPTFIILHFTAGSADSAESSFAADTAAGPGPVMKPGTSAHFLVREDGTIDALVPLTVRARHAVGFNDKAIGIEMEDPAQTAAGAENILNRATQLRAALQLVKWLQGKYDIPTKNVIGHAEARDNDAYTELVQATKDGDDHVDWMKPFADRFRRKL